MCAPSICSRKLSACSAVRMNWQASVQPTAPQHPYSKIRGTPRHPRREHSSSGQSSGGGGALALTIGHFGVVYWAVGNSPAAGARRAGRGQSPTTLGRFRNRFPPTSTLDEGAMDRRILVV